MLLFIVGALFALGLVYLPRIKQWLATMKLVGELQQTPDLFFAQHRKSKPYLDVDVPILPKQTYLFDYDLIRKVYATTAGIDYTMIKRKMDRDVFAMPDFVVKDPKQMHSITKIEHMFHREMSTSNIEELMQRFDDYAHREVAVFKKRFDTPQNIALCDELYTVMGATAVMAFWGDKLPAKDFMVKLRSFDNVFQGLGLAGMVHGSVGFLIREACKTGFNSYKSMLPIFVQWEQDRRISDSATIIQKMSASLVESGWTLEELATAHSSMVFALTTNASDAVSHLLLHLIQSPKLLARIKAEIATLPASDSDPSRSNMSPALLLKKLPHLESAVHEVLRMRTHVMSARVAKEDITVASKEHAVEIKKGRTILLPIRSLHTDPEVWDNPFTFQGARFVGDGESQLRNLYYFGAGVSRCAGRHFALAEIMAMAVHLLTNFDFDSSSIAIERHGQPFKGEVFEIDDMGDKRQGIWPGRLIDWKGNTAGVDRQDGTVYVRVSART